MSRECNDEVQAAQLSEEQDDRLRNRVNKEVLQHLAQICAELGARCGQYTRHVLMGEPAMVIGEFAEREQVDLIVMATRGQGAMKRLAFGSVTDKVLQQARRRSSPSPPADAAVRAIAAALLFRHHLGAFNGASACQVQPRRTQMSRHTSTCTAAIRNRAVFEPQRSQRRSALIIDAWQRGQERSSSSVGAGMSRDIFLSNTLKREESSSQPVSPPTVMSRWIQSRRLRLAPQLGQ